MQGSLGSPADLDASLVEPAAPVQAAPRNLIENAGFEDNEWLKRWTLAAFGGPGAPYSYCLDQHGGGHGSAHTHSGNRAIEIYSSDRSARLSQTVVIPAGTYRLSAWIRNNGSHIPKLDFTSDDTTITVPVPADEYRQYYVDFKIAKHDAHTFSFVSKQGGIAIDDVSLVRIEEPDTTAPTLFFDLSPTTRAGVPANVQTYLLGHKQWVHFTISTSTPSKLRSPRLRVLSPASVRVSGFSSRVLKSWQRDKSLPLVIERDIRDVVPPLHVHEVPLPRLFEGPESPQSIGGFWVEVPSGQREQLAIQLLEESEVVARSTLDLLPIAAPAATRRPKRFKIVFYCVQDWKMDSTVREEEIPRQFALVGGNVWSDHEITKDELKGRTEEDAVRDIAAKNYAVAEFWPNYPMLMESSDSAPKATAGSSFMTDRRGRVDSHIFNPRYAASAGEDWVDTWPRLIINTIQHPKTLNLAYRNSGFITDGLESVLFSFDEETIRDFTKNHGVSSPDVTSLIHGGSPERWLKYNMLLYARVARQFTEIVRRKIPSAILTSTAGSFGPMGVEKLSIKDQASWDRGFNYTMPQWYSAGYSDYYIKVLEQGIREKVYGRIHGRPDVIPLLNLSLGAEFTDPKILRFMMFDLVSADPVVRGIGYYTGTYAFADAKSLVDIAASHTMLADVEDYYFDGARHAGGVTFEPRKDGREPLQRPDGSCNLRELPPKVVTSVRLHGLRDGRKKLLITVVSHSELGIGDQGTLRFDFARLGIEPKCCVLVDHIRGRATELKATHEIDTRDSGNLALLEIVARNPASLAPIGR